MKKFQQYLETQQNVSGALWLKSGARFNTSIKEVFEDYIKITDKDPGLPFIYFTIDSIASWQPGAPVREPTSRPETRFSRPEYGNR